MLNDFINGHSFLGVNDQHFFNQVGGLTRHMARYHVVASQYFFVEEGLTLLIKRQIAAQHSVQSYPRAPNIHEHRVVHIPLDNFGGCVAWGTASSFQLLAFLVEVPKAEIDQFETGFGVH